MTQPGTQLKATDAVCLTMMVLRPLSETFCRLLLYAVILLKPLHFFFRNDDDYDDDDDETTTIMIICNMLFHLHFL